MVPVVLTFGASQAMAGDWTIAHNAGTQCSIAAQIGGGANLGVGDGIIVTPAGDPTIVIDNAAVPGLGDVGQAGITGVIGFAPVRSGLDQDQSI